MDKVFPQKLQQMAKDPMVKKAFLLEYPQQSGACLNCGGMGFISYFLATMGPFDEPGSGHMVSKYHDGKWWCAPGFVEPAKDDKRTNMRYGTVSDTCPVCHGIRKQSGPYVHPPEELVKRLIKKLSVK